MRRMNLMWILPFCAWWAAAPPAAWAATPAATPENTPSPIERLSQVEAQLKELQNQVRHGVLDAQEREERLKVGAFGDASYGGSKPDKSRPWTNRFALGEPSFFLTGRFGPHLSFVDENLIEFHGTVVGFGLGRVLVSYAFDRGLRLFAGRDHAATGFWNRTFGYAAIQQTTIERPFFLGFEDEGGVLPVHLVGLGAEGTFSLGGSQLQYECNLGNAPSLDLTGDGSGNVTAVGLDGHLTGDGADRKALAARLSFKPWADKGLSLGTATYVGRVDALAATPDLAGAPVLFRDLGQWALEGEAVWRDERLELMGEYYLFNDQVQGAATQGARGNRAFYAQAGVHLTEHWMPYLRAENLRAKSGDPYFTLLGPLKKSIYLAGVRIDLVPRISAVKLEGRVIQTDASRSMEAGAQWAFGF